MRERRLFVIATANFSADDAAWLARIRAEHQNLVCATNFRASWSRGARLTKPRKLTLVAHVAKAAASLSVARFVLRKAIVYPDAITGRSFAYLRPKEGNDELARIQDCLHQRLLASARRVDAPYPPHVTVGAFGEASRAESLVDSLNRDPIAIACVVEALRSGAFDGKTVQAIAETPSGAG